MKKLYTVMVEAEVVVLAENEEDAQDAAQEAIDDMGSYDLDYSVQPMLYLPCGWTGGEIPWGAQDDDSDEPERTVDAWIALGSAPELTKRMAEREAKKASEKGSTEK